MMYCECDIAFIQQFNNSLVMLCKKMLNKGVKIDYLSILFGSANKNTSLRIKLSLLPWQRSTHRLPLRQALTAGTTLLCISIQIDLHVVADCAASEISVG